MAKSVRMAFLDASFGAECIDDLAKSIPIECSMKLPQEKRSLRIFPILALGKIAPDESACRLSHIYNSTLASFGFAGFTWTYADLSCLHVYVSDAKCTQLTRS